MLKLLSLALLGVCTYAMSVPEVVDYYSRPEHVRRHMMGTKLDGNSYTQNYMVKEHSPAEAELAKASIPSTFDAKTNWPKCANVIGFIKDQAACGSCWAVSASEVIADRECIHCAEGAGSGNGNTNGVAQLPGNEPVPLEDVSAEDIMSCCSYCGDGCNGGYPIDAMRYYAETGVPSGGWFASKCGCQAYRINPTSHSMAPTPACQSACDDPSYPVSKAADRRMASRYYAVKGETAMQTEIMTNGPIECGFTVKQSFEDFFRNPANAQAVYVNPHKWFDRTLGGHAIKVLGWGTKQQNGKSINYWLINNSWNTTWADNGKFRYQRGGDLDGMESGCVAAMPKCNLSNAKSKSLQCKGRDF